MKCAAKRSSRNLSIYQPFPRERRLAKNSNLKLAELFDTLCREVGSEQEVYCYVIGTIKSRHGRFVQVGSAPNFQGDLITLCTCKAWMRTYKDASSWRSVWIAGFTGVKAGGGKNALHQLHRGQKKLMLGDLLAQLSEM